MVERYHVLSHPTQRDLVIVLEIEREVFLNYVFFRLGCYCIFLRIKSSHIVFRGQDIIRYRLYLCFLKL